MYDVIIVGGGPIGSITGSLIARENHKVLIIEKQKHPRWKPCGEGISQSGIQILKNYDLDKPIQDILWSINNVSINILTENIAKVRYDKPMAYTLDRSVFDYALFKQVQKFGAEIHENEKVINVTTNKNSISVKTTQKNYKSRLIIGADGIHSIIGRKLFRPWKKKEITPCLVTRYKLPITQHAFHPSTMEYYFIEGGYGWIFPRVLNDELILNIGIGKIGEIKSNLSTLFKKFILTLERGKKVKLNKKIDDKLWIHPIPTYGLSRKTHKENILLVGDAGGFVNPITGGGLRYGAVSAVYAAETVNLFLNDKIETLAVYENKYSKDIKYVFDEALKTREFLYRVNPSELLELLKEQPQIKEKLFSSFITGTK